MSSPPTAEGMEPLSSLVLRMEDPRREERCFYCHQCSAPFSTGDTLSVSLRALSLRRTAPHLDCMYVRTYWASCPKVKVYCVAVAILCER